jgi:mono/diheme cytochrome c family protein
MGLAQGPDGSLFISDSQKGRVWQIKYTGKKEQFSEKDLAKMLKRKKSSHIRDPDEKNDIVKSKKMTDGQKIYTTYCVACHAKNGKGDGQRFPPLENSEYVVGDKSWLIKAMLNGLNEEITIRGKKYGGIMPSHSFLSNKELASVLTYIRENFKNQADAISPQEVWAEREALKILIEKE